MRLHAQVVEIVTGNPTPTPVGLIERLYRKNQLKGRYRVTEREDHKGRGGFV